MENEIFTLKDENGIEQEFELVMKFDIEDGEYVILNEINNDEAVALKIVKDDDENEMLVTIDDDDEFKLVSEAYETLCLENN